MKTWKTIALTVITTSTLVTGGALTYSYLQPPHYTGDTFTNAKTTISSTTSSSSSSNSSESVETSDSSTNTNPIYTESNQSESLEQNNGTRAYQPTFKVECVSPKNDLYTVIHIPTGDSCKAITYEQAESFCSYMEQIAYGKTSLSYSMDENYNTYLTNNNN